MTTALLYLSIALIIIYFFFKKKKSSDTISNQNELTTQYSLDNHKIESISAADILTDENGLKYRIVHKTRELPRKTYIKAFLNGKYWGQIEESYTKQFQHSKFFDFYIYEATLTNAVYCTTPFYLDSDLSIPREKLPKLLKTILDNNGKIYELNLHEPVIASIKIDRKLHQNEGNEVFGTIDAIITGYILDFVIEEFSEKEYLIPSTTQETENPIIVAPILVKTGTPTGNIEHSGNYKRHEYFYSDYKKTYWKEWIYTKPIVSAGNKGFVSSVLSAIGGIITIAYLLLILPQLAILLPFLLIPFILNLIPANIYNWLFRILGILLFIGFITVLTHNFNSSANTYNPKPNIVESPKEQETHSSPIADPTNSAVYKDSLIKHFRVWEDYEGNRYEGYIWTKQSDYRQAKQYKNSLNLKNSSLSGYDEVIYLLKESDKQKLSGVYQLFDSIKAQANLSTVKFAELLVSFVQDIPYAIIVPDDCNPDLYDDRFIKEYLTSRNANCDGFEKFGINSPVEFMSCLYGDCDTRTLLLYTMLAHYGYDVALFSSEHYNHSIIGINLPLNGIAYKYQNQRYVLWETTAPNIRAGVLPNEISNLNYWRISLKSK